MSRGKEFHQYGYDHYLRAPKKPDVGSEKSSSGFMQKLKNPGVAVAGVLAVLLAFTGIVIFTYPSEQSRVKPIPVVKADLTPVKVKPVDEGGMSIPNKEVTLFERSDDPALSGDQAVVENLFAQVKEEPPVMKEQALEKADVEEVQAQIEEPSAENILQKIDNAEGGDAAPVVQGFEGQVAMAAVAEKPKHKQLHAPGQSPETIDFVRSVLNDTQAAEIEPSVGVAAVQAPKAAPAVPIQAGDYYVQLASITNSALAGGEWTKMQKKYSVLGDTGFRVQEASLSSGTFYRIQAGPMSKDSAQSICDSLKREGKPGGCLVVR